MENFVSLYNIILFVFFSLTVLLAFYKERSFAGKVENEEIYHERLWLLLIFSAALLLRVWDFGAIPGGVNQDGAMAAVDGKALADYGTDRFGTRLPAHLYAWGFGQMSSLLSYLIALFVKLMGLNVISMRLPQLLASIMGGLFFYLFVRDGFGKRAGLFGALLLALNPWHLLQSRWALDCNLLPHFFMAGLYMLQRGLQRERRYIYLSMLCFGLCMYCYGIAIYTVSLFLLCTGLLLLIKKQLSLSELLLCAGIWLLVSWPFILTMAINFFGWNTIELPFVTMQHFTGSVRAGDIIFFSDDFPAQLVSNIKSLVNVAFLQKKDLPWNDMAGFGTVYKFSMPLAAAGLYALCKNGGRSRLLAFSGLFTGIWAGVVTNNVNINRVNLVFYFILLLVVLGLEFVLSRLDRLKWSALAAYVLAGALMAGTYFGDYARSIEHYFFVGFGEALAAAEESGADVIYVTADTQYEGSRNVSLILTLFYDGTDAEYFQGKKNTDHGKELLPWSERFRFISMDEKSPRLAGENCAFVIKVADEQYFPETDWQLKRYGDYACAVKK